MLIEKDGQPGKTEPNSVRTSREGRKMNPSWKNTSRHRQDVIGFLSGNSTSPIFRVLICKLICDWQRQAWVWERILDVIRCLTPSRFVDWSLIGNESAVFPACLFCRVQEYNHHFKQRTNKSLCPFFVFLLTACFHCKLWAVNDFTSRPLINVMERTVPGMYKSHNRGHAHRISS